MPDAIGCGCVNVIDPQWQVLRNQSKCDFHKAHMRAPKDLDASYYEELGTLQNPNAHIIEFQDAFEELERLLPDGAGRIALEVGCGASRYVPMFIAHRYRYLGIDPSRWACEWVRSQPSQTPVLSLAMGLEQFSPEPSQFAVILAAHVAEHLEHAPEQIERMRDWLLPGGRLYLIVPDGRDDPWNPDHLWFFEPDSLKTMLDQIGYADIRLTSRRHVERERFIYCCAVKP